MNKNISPLGVVFIVLVWLSFLIMLGNSVYKGTVNLNNNLKTMDDLLHGNR